MFPHAGQHKLTSIQNKVFSKNTWPNTYFKICFYVLTFKRLESEVAMMLDAKQVEPIARVHVAVDKSKRHFKRVLNVSEMEESDNENEEVGKSNDVKTEHSNSKATYDVKTEDSNNKATNKITILRFEKQRTKRHPCGYCKSDFWICKIHDHIRSCHSSDPNVIQSVEQFQIEKKPSINSCRKM